MAPLTLSYVPFAVVARCHWYEAVGVGLPVAVPSVDVIVSPDTTWPDSVTPEIVGVANVLVFADVPYTTVPADTELSTPKRSQYAVPGVSPEHVPVLVTLAIPVIGLVLLSVPLIGLVNPASVEHCMVTVVDAPPGLTVALAVTVATVTESTLAAVTVGATEAVEVVAAVPYTTVPAETELSAPNRCQ